MKYYVFVISNGALQVNQITEWNDLESAKTEYWGKCRTLNNAQDVKEAYVVIQDSEFNVVQGYKERIAHEQA